MTKRTFDILMALLGLLLCSPAFLACFVVVRISSHGPAIFRQERIGLHGRPFMIYKFRTMIVNSEEEGTPQLAETNDERLTFVGSFLRARHIDELPQLWNVLRGDMSLVGYRPERPYFIRKIMELRPDYERLYAIRPGITSMATIRNGYTNTMDKMIRRLDMDLEYLEHHSFTGDLRIIILTVSSILAYKK
jgi:lipopolysaccharide/colanic/teichoic acid biosynthesis glycosyltransferase